MTSSLNSTCFLACPLDMTWPCIVCRARPQGRAVGSMVAKPRNQWIVSFVLFMLGDVWSDLWDEPTAVTEQSVWSEDGHED